MKKFAVECAVHDWVWNLPFTQQAVLLMSLRGPDGASRYCGAKYILYYIRGVIIKPAYPGLEGVKGYNPNTYMRADWENFDRDADIFFDDVDACPHHFLMHMFHAAQIIGYAHPDGLIRSKFLKFYLYACKALHMCPETMSKMNERLSQ